MTDRSPNAAASASGALPASPSTPLAKRKVTKTSAFAGVLSRIKSFGDRGGNTIGDRYAQLAGWVLEGVERIEDRSAERRFRRRLDAARASADAAAERLYRRRLEAAARAAEAGAAKGAARRETSVPLRP